jgi:ATP-binding cassette, subfamily B, multidrug efflux pump
MKQGDATAFNLWSNFIQKYWPVYLIGIVAIALTNLAQVIAPKLIGLAIDLIKGEALPTWIRGDNLVDQFHYIVLLFIINAILLMLMRMGWRISLARMTHLAASWLRKLIWQNARWFKRQDLIQTYTIGQLMNLSTSDVSAAKYIYGFTLVALFDVVFLGTFCFIAMYLINAKMALLTLWLVPIMPILMKKLASIEMLKFDQSQAYLTKFNEQVARAIETVRLQRLTQTGRFWNKKLVSSAEDYKDKRLDVLFTSFRYYPLMGFNSLVSYLILFMVGVKLVIDGEMSIGNFVAFQSFVFLIQDPLHEIGYVVSEIQRARASLKRIANCLNHEKDMFLLKDKVGVSPQLNVLEIENLSFGFTLDNRHILKNLSFKVSLHDKVGITGGIGSGKTTLLNIIAGLEHNYTGSIKLYGKPLTDYSHQDLREVVGFVSQKNFLFADTIAKNISLDQALTEEEIWYYLGLVELTDEVAKLNYGINTQLGEWGINLSGGQKQRLALARCLARKLPLMLFDDCLSAVDTVTEDKILNNLKKHIKETTIIWVAHRSSTLKHCQLVINLDDSGQGLTNG